MIQIVIPMLAGLSVVLIGSGILLARSARRARLAARLSLTSGMEVSAPSEESAMLRAVQSLGNSTWAGKASRSLREELARAGFHSKGAAATFIGGKLLLLAFGLALALIALSFIRLSLTQGTVFTMVIAMFFF